MRRTAITVIAALVAVLSMPVAPVLAASTAKVVVVVGPVGSHTAHYKADADAIVAEARRHTANVTKIYTPKATWSRVKAAVQGANVLVYLGHGNGWPSIYAPFQTKTKDGLGLDPSTGADGTKTVYYGEDYIRANIRLAPNAVVLLFHLCYASGNTEPGLATGSFTDSRLRVDNYGAGFIGAGARAVFAEGHPEHPVTSYVRQLFTTSRTMGRIFRSTPTWHGHLYGPYASQRTPGLSYQLDSDTATPSGFYRSLVGDLSLSASAVTGPTLQSTDTNPAEFVIPGAAEVTGAAGAGLFATADAAADPAATASKTLAVATRLRVDAEAAPAADGTRILEVTVLGATTHGFVRAMAVAPRDSAPVVAWNADESSGTLSPNGDNNSDALVVTTRFSESVASTFVVRNAAGTTVKSMSMTADIARYAWNLRNGAGDLVPNGSYTWSLKGRDTWGNAAITRTGTFVVDTVAPVSKATAESTLGGDGWSVSPVTITVTSKDAVSGVASISWRVDGGATKTYGDPVVYGSDGTHKLEYRAVDEAGNREAWHALGLKIDTKPPVVKLPLTGIAGDAAGTWRGPVTITPSIADATSGVAARTMAVDDAAPVALGTSPVTVKGDGAHTVTVAAKDVAGNETAASATFIIDTTAPVIELPPVEGSAPVLSPNGDGTGERAAIAYTVSEAATVAAVVAGADGTAVRSLSATSEAGPGSVSWDGRTDAGAPVPDGTYTMTLTPRDRAGNAGEPVSTGINVYAALAAIARSPSLFYPQDADTLAQKSTVRFTLASPATVSVQVLDASGTVVRTAMADRALPAGPVSWAWNGKRDDGTYAPVGSYRFAVSATDGTLSGSLSTTVRAGAFRITTSTSTATRGKAIKITAVTAEPLSTTPKLYVRQPGVTAWSVTMTKVSSTKWVATVTPKKAGRAGTMSLTVKATDSRGGTNSSVLRVALR